MLKYFNRDPDTDECFASIIKLSLFSIIMIMITLFIWSNLNKTQ